MKKTSIEIEEKILELSKEYSQNQISKILGIGQSTISRLFKRHSLKFDRTSKGISNLPLDVLYFDNIDTHEKAYWLGFICADGSLKNKKCSLVSKDLEVIEKFKENISSGHKITHNKIFDKRTNKIHENYSIQITNELFVENIIKWGININKSNECKFPKIEEMFYCSFIAGLFDGDGSIFKKKGYNVYYINLLSTYDIIFFIQQKLKDIGIKEISLEKLKNNLYRFYLYKDTLKFLNFIYSEDSKIYLQRKYKKYLDAKIS